jgi:diguanylate cyclase (GGDEF)-like protein/PAS domain S-box-containing protein
VGVAQPNYLAQMSRSSHDVAAIMTLGAQAAAVTTSSAAAVLVRQSGRTRLGALHDEDVGRRETFAAALGVVPLDGPASPFSTALESGQNALLGIDGLAFGDARPEWASHFDRLGIVALGITPLIAGDRALGLLVTARLGTDDRMSTEDLAEQATVASHLTTFLDTATALTQMRQSSLVVDAMPDAIIGFSRDREVILWNAGAERMYEITEQEALGRKLDDLITTEYGANQGNGGPAISLINKGSWTGRVRQRTLHGRVLHVDVSIASIVEDGRLRGAVSINRDVSSLIEAELAKAENERRMQALLDASRAMTAVFDREGTILAVNSAWTEGVLLGGVEPDKVGIGADYISVLRRAAGTSEDAAAVAAGVEAVLSSRVPVFEWDYDVTDPEGTPRAYMVSVAPMPGSQGGAFATHTDITTRKVMERQMAHQAHHDPLTGLRTRRRVEQDLEPSLARSVATGRPLGAVIVDLDRFKDVNDTLGHEAGDQVLVQMAARLSSFKAATITGRLAGDEFVLIVPNVRDRAELARLAGDLARVITAPLVLGDRELYFGVNIGTALSVDTQPGPDAAANLLRAADTAMYRAKARGRNSIVAYDEGLRADVGRRVQISSWLNHAVDRGEISVAYQPQFRCLDGRQVGVEALMRWRHPEAGDISPAEFIAIAEESGAILTMGAWVLTQACMQAAEWAPISGPDFSVAVNLSPHQLIDPGLLDIVRSALLRSRLPATSLTLEVTEGALIEDPEAAAEALARLRALGVRISLDDFGTGYSSLAYLAKFPVDELKVDRVFVRDIERDPRTRALAEGIVRIGHALGMRVLAEGVELPGQLRILTGAGCDFYQGFIAAPAETVERATERLADRNLGRDIPADAALAAGRAISWE